MEALRWKWDKLQAVGGGRGAPCGNWRRGDGGRGGAVRHPDPSQVRHLEVSSASMAEDLCRKSAIIESFVRDSRLGEPHPRSPPMPPMGPSSSPLPFPPSEAAGPPVAPRRGAGPGEEGLREMNKKLQNLLEEQLTKNLHMSQVGGAWG